MYVCMYSKFEVLTIFILNNKYDVVDFDPPLLKISMICARTLLYLLEGCVFALLIALSVLLMCLFSPFVNSYMHT